MRRLLLVLFGLLILLRDVSAKKKEGIDWNWLRASGRRAIESELERSLRAFSIQPELLSRRGDVEEFVAQMLRMPKFFMLILNNKVLVSKPFLHIAKHIKHASYVRTALDIAPSPNVIFQFEGGASGTSNRFECGGPKPLSDEGRSEGQLRSRKLDKPFFDRFATTTPRLCIAKREGYERCGVLVPNGYIGNLTSYYTMTRHFYRLAQGRPFSNRDERLFWRGAILAHTIQKDCNRETGNYARFAAASLTYREPTHFDIRCLKCSPRDEKRIPCDYYKYDHDMTAAYKDLSKISGDFLSAGNYSFYKYVLNLPGCTTGSYSRNLNHLWALGSVVLLWQNSHVEWYYPGLIEGVTHLTVNKSNAPQVMHMLRKNNDLSKRLIQGARFVQNSFLCNSCMAKYHRKLILAFRQRFNLDLLLDNPDRLIHFLNKRQIDCQHLDLVEFHYFDEIPHFSSKVSDLSGLTCKQIIDYVMDRPNKHRPTRITISPKR